MPEQLTDNRKPKPTARTEAGIGVTEIVKADTFEPRTPSHRLPRTFQIGARLLGIVAWYDIRAEPIEAGQNSKGRSIEDHRLPARLGVSDKKHPAFQIHLFPFEMQDFPEPTAGE